MPFALSRGFGHAWGFGQVRCGGLYCPRRGATFERPIALTVGRNGMPDTVQQPPVRSLMPNRSDRKDSPKGIFVGCLFMTRSWEPSSAWSCLPPCAWSMPSFSLDASIKCANVGTAIGVRFHYGSFRTPETVRRSIRAITGSDDREPQSRNQSYE